MNEVERILDKVKKKQISRSDATIMLNKLKEKPKDERNTSENRIEDIAVIGMSAQFPGGNHVNKFWDNMVQGKISIDELSYGERIGDIYKWGGVLEEREYFDPLFFNISPKEARSMNVHQRLIIQEGWRAFEDAGYNPLKFRGRKVSIYIGAEPTGYMKDSFTGYSDALIASRLSYFLDLRGEALVINTGCSSSAVAIHLACESIRNGTSELALAGGVAAHLDQNILPKLQDMGMLSQHGECKSFDEQANGTVISEGVGVLVLKRLDRAIRDSDHIYGTIIGSGLNQDGASNGITAPNGEAQEELILDTYNKFQINPSDISYIEAHGTGTRLGDPIEVNALKRAYEKLTEDRNFCKIGSAKSYIGHTAAASGVFGLIKILLSMKHKLILGTSTLDHVNHLIDIKESPFVIEKKNSEWCTEIDKPFMAALNSFGHSGTNAHIVVKEFVDKQCRTEPVESGWNCKFAPFSAKSKDSLNETLKRYVQYLDGAGTCDKEEVKYFITECFSHMLSINSKEVEPDYPFIELGIDIQMFTMIVSKIETEFDCEIDDLVYSENSSINSVISLVSEKVLNKNSHPQCRDLGQICYTLQVGRASLEYRVGFLVETVEELIVKIRSFLRGEKDGFYYNHIKKANHNIQTDIEYKSRLDRETLQNIAIDWVNGSNIEWENFYDNKPMKVSLPTYEFEKERYPVENREIKKSDNHFVDVKFTGEESFLKDHVVESHKTLPGVMYLRLFIDALKKYTDLESTQISIKNIIWNKPYYDANQNGLRIELALENERTYICKANSEQENHAQASIEIDAQKANVHTEFKRNSKKVIFKEQIYEIFERLGFCYGLNHKVLDRIEIGSDYVYGDITVSEENMREYGTVSNPSILDGALQATIGFTLENKELEDKRLDIKKKKLLPYSIDCVNFYGFLERKMKVLIQRTPNTKLSHKLDVFLINEQGEVCVELLGFYQRPLSNTEDEIVLFEQKKHVLSQNFVADSREMDHYIFIIGNSKIELLGMPQVTNLDYHGLDGFKHAASKLFELMQFLLKRPLSAEILFQVVVSRDFVDQEIYNGLIGLFLTAKKENPLFHGQMIDIDSTSDMADAIRAGRENPAEPLIALEDGMIQFFRWEKMIDVPSMNNDEVWREGGVYLVTGGAGEIGLIFAEEIIRNLNKCKVILFGRSKYLSQDKQNRIETLQCDGKEIQYISLDITDREEVSLWYKEFKESGNTVAGVIHCAGVIKDNFIIKKTMEEFHTVIAPKISGALNLDFVLKEEKLDFFSLFSSGSGALGNAGQVDYSVGNSFLDGFAKYRNNLILSSQRYGRTFAIDWPLWKNGGMKVDKNIEEDMYKRMGMRSMPDHIGIEVFYKTYVSGRSNLMAIYGNRDKINEYVLSEEAVSIESRNKNVIDDKLSVTLEAVSDFLIKVLADTILLSPERIDAESPMERYGIDSVLSMDLTDALEKTFGSLSKTLFFEYQTIQELANYFLNFHMDKLKTIFGNHNIEKDLAQLNEVSGNLEEESDILRDDNDGDDIAIIGVAGKYPNAENIQEFWDILCEGRNCISEIPKDRWDYRTYFNEDKNKDGSIYSKWGGFIDGAYEFDAPLFHISPYEAELMDPQERLFLQCAYHCFEDAGYSREELKRSNLLNCGVFVGVMYEEYQFFGVEESLNGRPIALGGSPASVANRVSYFFDLHGPSMAVDTMCSSSLAAINIAYENLKSGRCKMAIAGGVNLNLHPNKYFTLSQGKFASTKGLCESFAEGGDGYVPGEGVGAILLKPLSLAKQDGDHIYGLLKGSAINHGGKTNGYSVPNPIAQAEVIHLALEDADILANEVSYIEAHGTGTALGDPIEINGLSRAFGLHTDENQFCAIGSVKSNIGHCEGAAGIAGVTKLLLQIQHETLVPSIHAKVTNKKIDFENSPFYLQKEISKWNLKDNAKSRIAGISSFGAGGSNAHMILSEYKEKKEETPVSQDRIFILSANSREQLLKKSEDMLAFLKDHRDSINIADLTYTLQNGREQMDYRIGCIVDSMDECIQQLSYYVDGKESKISESVIRSQDKYQLTLKKDDMKRRITKWVENNEYMKVLELWLEGYLIQWRDYDNTRYNRISLPAYPFLKQEYRIKTTNLKEAALPRIHPLIHVNHSTLSKQCYRSKFESSEYFFQQHIIQEQGVIPASIYLEMAAQAMRNGLDVSKDGLGGFKIKNIGLQMPVYAKEDGQELKTTIEAGGISNLEFAFSISASEAECCTGVVELNSNMEQSKWEIPSLMESCSVNMFSKEECYEIHRKKGIHYGPDFQVIDTIWVGDSVSIAQINLSAAMQEDLQSYLLHPILMDAAFHSTIGLYEQYNNLDLAVPYSIDEIEFIKNCDVKMYAISNINDKKGMNKLDIQLCDVNGNVCISIKGLFSRSYKRKEKDVKEYKPVWKPMNIDNINESKRDFFTFIIGLPQVDLDEITNAERIEIVRSQEPNAFMDSVIIIFKRIKEWLSINSGQRCMLQVVYEKEINQFLPALSGFLKTIQKENPLIEAQLLELDGESCHYFTGRKFRELLIQNVNRKNDFVRYSAKKRYIQCWEELVSEEIRQDERIWEDEAVYIFSGGLGGIASIIAEDIVNNTKGAMIVLLGRSVPNEKANRRLQELSLNNAEVVYRQVDINDGRSVQNTISNIISSYGKITGIFHCAGIHRDSYILQKTENEVREVLLPKIIGTQNIFDAIKDHLVDFVLLFSSATGAVGNSGQSDYAVANNFLDVYASIQNREWNDKTKVLSINWPLWKDGGMQVGADIEKLMYEKDGTVPLSSDIALDIIKKRLRSQERQILVEVKGGNYVDRKSRQVKEMKEEVIYTTRNITKMNDSQGNVIDFIRSSLTKVLKMEKDKIDIYKPFDEFGLDSVMIMKVTRDMEAVLGPIPKTIFFEYQTVIELADFFSENYEDKFIHSNESQKPTAIPKIVRDFVDREEKNHNEIAIIGLAGRYPMAENMEEFWENLSNGQDCITEIPMERWDKEKFYVKDKNSDGIYSKWGGFISDVDKFDSLFFGITPREAERMDPQERLFLECVYHTIEDAGYTKETLNSAINGDKNKVGVFVGAMYQEYQLYGAEYQSRGIKKAGYGNSASIANRVSYFYNFHGPSLSLDSMCSSSLTAIHLACQSIKSGESNMAIAGGVNLSLHPNKYLLLSQGKFASDQGICNSFGEGGNGYVPGEGVGAILLKPLEEAIRDKDNIYGVVKGSSVNHGGRTNGYTVPNPNAQAELIKETIVKSGVSPEDISYVEAHGTGTQLGDPIEINGLVKAFQVTTKTQFCAIGSVKSNIGHCESAAGIAGLSKLLLQLKYKMLVPSIHANVINKNILFEETPFRLQDKLQKWDSDKERIAAISSFGAGGTNAHFIISEYLRKPFTENMPSDKEEMIVLSADSREQLHNRIEDLIQFAAQTKENFCDIAYTLQIGREQMRYRTAFIASSIEEMIDKLKSILEGADEGIYHGQIPSDNSLLKQLFYDEEMKGLIKKWYTNLSLRKVMELWVNGVDVEWRALRSSDQCSRIRMPGYRFERVRHWLYDGFESSVQKEGDLDEVFKKLDKEEISLDEAVTYIMEE